MSAHPNPPPQKINKQYNTKQQNQNKINNPRSKALGIPWHNVNLLNFLTYQ